MVVVTRKYQVTLPREVREDMGVKIGDEVIFVKKRDGSYRIMTKDELIEESCELCEDIGETVEEPRKGLGKGIGK